MFSWIQVKIGRAKAAKADAARLIEKYGREAHQIAIDRAEGRANPADHSASYWGIVARHIAKQQTTTTASQ